MFKAGAKETSFLFQLLIANTTYLPLRTEPRRFEELYFAEYSSLQVRGGPGVQQPTGAGRGWGGGWRVGGWGDGGWDGGGVEVGWSGAGGCPSIPFRVRCETARNLNER